MFVYPGFAISKSRIDIYRRDLEITRLTLKLNLK